MPNLKEVRIKLDQMTEKIISRLKDRSRYKINSKVYKRDAIPIKNRKNISFFEFSLEGLEKYHASLGRYKFPDQFPITKCRLLSKTKRNTPNSFIENIQIDIRNEVIKYYISSLKDFCRKGEDAYTYGETVYCDADIVELLHERINLGRYVAQLKLKTNPILLKKENREKLEHLLRDKKREKKIINKVVKLAKRYNFPSSVAKNYFRWIIDETTKVEVEYLKGKIKF